MAYATIAGLPVHVGLYTTFLPMLIYAAFGTSRALSVSTTTTLAILVGAALRVVCAERRHRHSADCFRHPHAACGRDPRSRVDRASGLRRELHLGACPGRLQGGHRARHRGRPAPEPARTPHPEGAVPLVIDLDRREPARHLSSDPGGRSRNDRDVGGPRAIRSARASAPRSGLGRNRGDEPARAAEPRRRGGGPDPARPPLLRRTGPLAPRVALAGPIRPRGA